MFTKKPVVTPKDIWTDHIANYDAWQALQGSLNMIEEYVVNQENFYWRKQNMGSAPTKKREAFTAWSMYI